ncbi:uncharacterized protein LOC131024324 isoform X2 [Salvia miltiorrhiza]|uniref:uncharacterized protein LOC131024324 isoform X2 n=1 Tax=Salvia miltiorrhiza TaxID=226208 RepID=UPI0025ABEEC1|nr:uncharacterized protein LOC131024324 isoform X2 [Salvia miltiorrhiza]
MAYYDFEPPSFSLGLDFDLSQPQTTPPPDPIPQPAKRPSSAPNLRPIEEEDDDDFECPVRVSEPPRALKRLRRVTTARPRPPSQEPKVDYKDQCVDDDIEDFSSDEDSLRGSLPSNSVCSSSKPSLHRKKVVTSEPGMQWISPKGKEFPSSSASINVETRGSSMIFPKLTVSPLRRFQLIDSDSDDPSTIEDTRKETPSVVLSPEEKEKDHRKGTKTSVGKHQTKDLWKDLCPERSSCIPTPAFDEFCNEYFTGLNNKSMAKIDCKHTGIGANRDKTSLPPAHCYFFHNDSRIQKLVRERLPHFFPLEVGNNQDMKQQNVSVIDYMGQFGGEQDSRQTSRKQTVEKNSKISKKNTKSLQVDGTSEHSGKWVTPKTCAAKNAGSRKEQAVGGCSGTWYTGQNGQRVYVTKNGEELTGRIAYRQYKKVYPFSTCLWMMHYPSPVWPKSIEFEANLVDAASEELLDMGLYALPNTAISIA